MINRKVSVIIQARTRSTRLPNKVLLDLSGRTLLEFQIERIKRSRLVSEIIIATTNKDYDDPIEKIGNKLSIKVIRGDEFDVLSRFHLASQEAIEEILVRITGDCPFVDPTLLDEMINSYMIENIDYLSNGSPPTYPDGLDIEIFSKKILEEAYSSSVKPFEREHVTPWIKRNDNYLISNQINSEDYSYMRWTIDEPEDYEVIKEVVNHFDGRSDFHWKDVIKLEQANPQIFNANKKFQRNEGASLSSGQKLWRRAKRVIPGGNMLLSKRPEMFLPDNWPTYFSKAKGCHVWDLDGKKLFDMSIMGIGTNTLGYGHPEVDEAVNNVIKNGNLSTLNCPEEVFLAEKLVDMHKWADMARFARTGGEANSISIRIARAATGRDTVAICGYHGWHDWYLSTNLQDEKGLESHLLPGLEPNGVPKQLLGTTQAFYVNRLDQLEKIANNYKLAAVKMEVQRSVPPEEGFLKGVRELCDKKGIVLIFDECSSGFRETFGGIHKKYKVDPDMAIFGKTLGNGYAITAIIGKRSVMDAAQNTFISSTFWTERIGPVAALKTLEIMEREKSWEIITSVGQKIRNGWQKLADFYNLKISHYGILPLASFAFESSNHLKYKTLISQEMLKRGYLASNICYACTSHNSENIDLFFEKLDEVFSIIAKCEAGESIDKYLEFPVCHSGFKRLN